jgi:hypothetical protein
VNDNTEVRDELARLAYWRKPDPERGRLYWSNDKTAQHSETHPIPNTLDEAATLHSDWGWNEVVFAAGGSRATASAYRKSAPGMQTSGFRVDEKAARFHVRLAIEKIEHERKNK